MGDHHSRSIYRVPQRRLGVAGFDRFIRCGIVEDRIDAKGKRMLIIGINSIDTDGRTTSRSGQAGRSLMPLLRIADDKS